MVCDTTASPRVAEADQRIKVAIELLRDGPTPVTARESLVLAVLTGDLPCLPVSG